ncbi:hypothetical protein Dimus_028847 [Dionaea muscipula]
MIDFGSLESGVLDDGRIKILTDVTHFFFDFKLLVDGDEFDCWVVKEGSVTMMQRQGCLDPPGSSFEQPREDQRIHDLGLGAAMADSVQIRRFPGLFKRSPSADGLAAVSGSPCPCRVA